jgi:hypothetical protein
MRGRLLAFSVALFLVFGGVPAYAHSPSPAADQLMPTARANLPGTVRSPAVTLAPSYSRFPDGAAWGVVLLVSAGALAAVGAALRHRERRHRQGVPT